MESIINKAIEGGWVYNIEIGEIEDGIGEPVYQIAFCDPFFWQSLGKACGWGEEWVGNPVMSDAYIQVTWCLHALRFHEINLTEGWDAAIKYLEELLK